MMLDDTFFGWIRLVGSLIAIALYGVLVWDALMLLQHDPGDIRLMRELTLTTLLLLTVIAFLLSSIALLVPAATNASRFINSVILGALIYGGWHLLMTVRRKHRIY